MRRFPVAYLALHQNQAVDRNKLAGLLWSQRQEKQARNSLSGALTDLRNALGKAHPSPLLIEAQQVTLVARAVETDVVRFERLAGSEDAEDLEKAIALYGGDFLSELEVRDPVWGEWCDGEQRRLQQLYGSVLNRLLSRYENAGLRDQAVAIGARLIAHEPLEESAYT